MHKVRDTKQTKQIKSNPQQKLPICYGFGTEPIVQLNAVHNFFPLLGTDMYFINSTNYPTAKYSNSLCTVKATICVLRTIQEQFFIRHSNFTAARKKNNRKTPRIFFFSTSGHSNDVLAAAGPWH